MEEYRKRTHVRSSGSSHGQETKENRIIKSSRKSYCSTDVKYSHSQCLSLIESERPGNLDLLLSLPNLPYDSQVEHSWNPEDCSSNIYVKHGDPFTFHRRPVAKSTDCIRGKFGYRDGLHFWEIKWPHVERGTHAVVGFATQEAALHCDGYRDLLGSDSESWGWDIVRCVAMHGNKSVKKTYPSFGAISGYDQNSNGHYTFDVPSTFYAVLDMDEGTLSYIANGRFLGVVFNNLKGKTLYPIISAVWGNCEVSMKYMNGLKPRPSSLMHLSRSIIRRRVIDVGGVDSLNRLDDLHYPSSLKDYLNHRVRVD